MSEKEKRPIVPISEVLHFYKLIKEGNITVSEFSDVWNESIDHAIEIAIKKAVESEFEWIS